MTAASRIVVALGGNAISQPHEEGNVDQQFANSRRTAQALADLVADGHQLVITHGNGPQIGNFLLRNQVAAHVIYPLPMEVAVAHVQGGMGYMIAQTLMNELHARGIERPVVTFVTTVLVERNDPSFQHPTKPIGRAFSYEEALRLTEQEGWQTREVSEGVYRRVVPSPMPQRILEIDSFRRSVDAGDLVVACGGGGVPVIREHDGRLGGVRAVIDKDLASALLAAEIRADTMMILTNVDRVCLDFGKPAERSVDRMTVDEAEAYMRNGQFPAGSMGPKVEGGINFLRSASSQGAKVIIGPLHDAHRAIAGEVGTLITKA